MQDVDYCCEYQRVDGRGHSAECMWTWWNSITEQERIWWAAKMAGADADVLYAIEKPWKYMEDAYRAGRVE